MILGINKDDGSETVMEEALAKVPKAMAARVARRDQELKVLTRLNNHTFTFFPALVTPCQMRLNKIPLETLEQILQVFLLVLVSPRTSDPFGRPSIQSRPIPYHWSEEWAWLALARLGLGGGFSGQWATRMAQQFLLHRSYALTRGFYLLNAAFSFMLDASTEAFKVPLSLQPIGNCALTVVPAGTA